MNKAAGAMSYDELRGAIAQRHRALSGRLQQIAEFVLDHPTDVALGTVAEVAQRSGVPPSAIVRFAHALGFGGFTEMQQVFRSRLVAGVAPSYKARLARMKSQEKSVLGRQPAAVLSRFVSEAQSALVTLSQSVHARELDAATAILAKARDIYLLGLGGSFPVAIHWPTCCASWDGVSSCSTAPAAASMSSRMPRPRRTRWSRSASGITIRIRRGCFLNSSRGACPRFPSPTAS